MEQFVTILEQRALVSRAYTDNQGTQRVFYTRGFILSNGLDDFYAEMTGDMATQCIDYDKSTLHRMQGTIRQRRFTDKNGQERFENQIYITKLA